MGRKKKELLSGDLVYYPMYDMLGNKTYRIGIVIENAKNNFYKVYVSENLGKENLQIFHAVALVPIIPKPF